MNTFKQFDVVVINNKMQKDYSFQLVEKQGAMPDFFNPVLTPRDMLRLGVFEGKYMTDCGHEYPIEMFEGARFSCVPAPIAINAFKAKSRTDLKGWQEKGWIHPQDPRGWFEWYCRYYLGRRTKDDERQIKRWVCV